LNYRQLIEGDRVKGSGCSICPPHNLTSLGASPSSCPCVIIVSCKLKDDKKFFLKLLID